MNVDLESIRVDCAASTLAALGLKEAEMRLIAYDLHASQQSIAMLDRDTGVVVEKTLKHEGEMPANQPHAVAAQTGSRCC